MKKAIYNPFTNIPRVAKSHERGYAIIWQQRIKDSELKYGPVPMYTDRIYFYHGVNATGNLNLFGGVTTDLLARLQALVANYPYSDYRSLGWDMKTQTTYGKRLKEHMSPKQYEYLETYVLSAKPVRMHNLRKRHVILGDSHSIAFSRKHEAVEHRNGQLLYSVLRDGLENFIRKELKKYDFDLIDSITLCLGSIDIRYHLDKNDKSATQFGEWYVGEVEKFSSETGKVVNVSCAVPVEHESRVIPKAGAYKGQKFTKSRDERLAYTMEFNDYLRSHMANHVVSPPGDWYYLDGQHYADAIMERVRGVHIAPENYCSIGEHWETPDV